MLPLLVGTRFQVYFTPRQGCFSPFPLGTVLYRSLNVFSLRPWAAWIRTEFHVLRITWVAVQESFLFRLRGFHSLWLDFPTRFSYK